MAMIPEAHRLHENGSPERIEYVSNENGSMQVHFCMRCHRVVAAQCEHDKNTWHDAKGDPIPKEEILGEGGRRAVRLTCDLCGADGT